MWTQEPGVGRDMTTRMALIAENDGKAGAHEAATYYPQPTFISSRHYALHVDSPAYAVLDFTSPMFHEIEVWDTDFRFELFRDRASRISSASSPGASATAARSPSGSTTARSSA